MTIVPEILRRQVREITHQGCEYCLLPEWLAITPFEPDHIIAEKHGGATVLDNLAWSCFLCNRHKGSDISSVDPLTRRIVPLFNPRTQQWRRHFHLNGPRIEPMTACGRATVTLLQFNVADRIGERQKLMASGNYP